MKKIITVILAGMLCLSFAACSNTRGAAKNPETTPVPSPAVTTAPQPSSTPETLPENTPRPDVPSVNSGLLTLLEEVIYTAAPGTAGSSLKAVYATRDLMVWLGENHPSEETVALTVARFMDAYSDTEEALWAYESVENVLKSLTERDMAESVLAASDLTVEELHISSETMAAAGVIFDTMDKYR